MSIETRSLRIIRSLMAAQLIALSTPALAQTTAPTPLQANYAITTNQGMDLPGFEWSLPCEGRLEPVTKYSGKGMLQGTVTTYDVDTDFGNLIDNLLDGALSSTTKFGYLDKAVAHYRKPAEEKKINYKDALNWALPYRGFAPSSEAADVILNEKIKIKDRASSEYARQRYVDQIHPQVVAKTMQLAMALGLADKIRRAEAVDAAMASLSKLSGKPNANAALKKLQGWSKTVKVPGAVYTTAGNWDVEFFQNKLRSVTKLAMDGDPVMKEVVKRLEKYNHRSLISRGTAKVVEGGLSVGSWVAPGLVIPIALEVINGSYIMSTGGSEESKLIKEMYYDKRVESRYRAVNEEAQMALTQYQNALNSKNPVLLVCCESVLTQLVGSENIQEVLGGRTLLTHRIPGQRGIETAQSAAQSVQ